MEHKKPRPSLAEAWQRLDALPIQRQVETVSFRDALQRVLAEDIYAARTVPAFDRSPLDGYAARAVDIAAASPEQPVTLRITEEIAAGSAPTRPVGAGEAAKILTGAPIPAGADIVQKFEETDFTVETVTFYAPLKPQSNIVPAGEDVKHGDLIAETGSVVTPPLQGLLASIDHRVVQVFKQPLITMINTGSELTEPGEDMPLGKIRNSGRYSLGGYLAEDGILFNSGTVVEDEAAPLAGAIEETLATADMVITTGGVSVGDYDMVRAAVDLIGARQLFWKINIKPGGSMLAAVKDDKLILGLSGNPASAALGLHLIGLPFIRRLAGRRNIFPPLMQVTLLKPINKKSPHGRLVRGTLVLRDGKTYFKPMASQANGALSSLYGWDTLVTLPPDTPPLPAGAIVDGYWLYGPHCQQGTEKLDTV